MNTLIYFLFWAALFFLMMRFGCGAHVMGHRQSRHNSQSGDGAAQASGKQNLRWIPPDSDTDPVCGKTVHTASAKPSIHDGMVYYLCSQECRELFEAAPEQYLGRQISQDTSHEEHSHA